MDAKAVNSFLTNAEFLIWLAAFVAAAYGRVYRQFPAVLCFLGVKMVTAGAYSYLEVVHPLGSPGATRAYSLFFEFYWAAYAFATVAVFFSIEQIIRSVLAPLSGLSRLGVLIFRFTGGLTLFIALTAHISEMGSVPFAIWVRALFISFGLCMCVFEVSLMSLLMTTAHRLGVTFRTRIFGLSLGLCFLGIIDFLALVTASDSKWAGGGLSNEVLVFLTLLMWVGYFLLPDHRRGGLRIAGSSTLMRWNEIVSQLGPEPQAAPEVVTSFMSDVEILVERIMMRSDSRHL